MRRRCLAGILTAFALTLIQPGTARADALEDEVIGSDASDDYFGISVEVADFTRDGYDDLAVGASYYGGIAESGGLIAVYQSDAHGASSAGLVWSYAPAEAYANVGYDITTGDFDGDGWPDLAYYHRGYPVVVVHGSEAGLDSKRTQAVEVDDCCSSQTIATLGDVDGDGDDELGVTNYYWDSDECDEVGRVHVFYGDPAGLGKTSQELYAPEPSCDDYFGLSVAGLGDVNGDGYDDAAVSAVGGRVYVHLGGPKGVAETADLEMTLVYEGSSSMHPFVSGAGDLDGDGLADLAVGALWNEQTSTSYNAPGAVYVYRGDARAGIDTSSEVLLQATDADKTAGDSAWFSFPRRGGDVNGDGYDDLLVGAPWHAASGKHAGAAYVFFGGSDLVSTDRVRLLVASDGYEGQQFGTDLAGGDFNGDGANDVAVGVTARNGAVYLYYGCIDADLDGTCADDDCNDNDPEAQVGSEEVCNGVDDDCDGVVDGEDATDASTWYADADGDGYTSATDVVTDCEQPEGFSDATEPSDCDDSDPDAYPGAVEVEGDGVDQDCDGEDAPGADTGPPDTEEHERHDTGAADTGGGEGDKGCSGCASGLPAGSLLGLLGLIAVHRRRR